MDLDRLGYVIIVGEEERGQVAADWANAGSSIYYRFDADEEWEITPFQVANARHRPSNAVLLVDEWLGDGFLEDGEEFDLQPVVD